MASVVQALCRGGANDTAITLAGAPTEGNLLVAIIIHATTGVPTAASGWTVKYSGGAGAGSARPHVFTKTAGASETAAQNPTTTTSASALVMYEVADATEAGFQGGYGKEIVNSSGWVVDHAMLRPDGTQGIALAGFGMVTSTLTGVWGLDTVVSNVTAAGRSYIGAYSTAAQADELVRMDIDFGGSDGANGGIVCIFDDDDPPAADPTPDVDVVQAKLKTSLTTTSITLDAAPTEGNMLVAIVTFSDLAEGNPAAGWTKQDDGNAVSPYHCNPAVYTKIVGAAESATQNSTDYTSFSAQVMFEISGAIESDLQGYDGDELATTALYDADEPTLTASGRSLMLFGGSIRGDTTPSFWPKLISGVDRHLEPNAEDGGLNRVALGGFSRQVPDTTVFSPTILWRTNTGYNGLVVVAINDPVAVPLLTGAHQIHIASIIGGAS